MSNLARKYQTQTQEVQQPKKSFKPKVKKSLFTKGEKFLYIAFACIVFFFSTKIISNQAHIYEVNKEIQQVKTTMTEQQKVTEDLESQVNELSEYSRVLETAKKQGLKINENNVKVVQNK